MTNYFLNVTPQMTAPPVIELVGQIEHPDFRDAMELLRTTAETNPAADVLPELFVIAQSRPGAVCRDQIELLQRRAPLAGMVALAGSWCEGETRTGRPWPGVPRLYWYEFAAWWRRQLALRAADLTTDWARAITSESARGPLLDPKLSLPAFRKNVCSRFGPVVISTECRDRADVLTELLTRAGYAVVNRRRGQSLSVVRGAIAGIWDGGQLDYREANDLTAFCRALARDAAPVAVLLDFPRRHRVSHAHTLGAATVIAKPWISADLVTTLERMTGNYGATLRAA